MMHSVVWGCRDYVLCILTTWLADICWGCSNINNIIENRCSFALQQRCVASLYFCAQGIHLYTLCFESPLCLEIHHYCISYSTTVSATALLYQLQHYCISYSTTVSATALLYQLQHYCISYSTTVLATALLYQLQHYCISYSTTVSATALLYQLQHYCISYSTTVSATALLYQLQHYCISYSTTDCPILLCKDDTLTLSLFSVKPIDC